MSLENNNTNHRKDASDFDKSKKSTYDSLLGIEEEKNNNVSGETLENSDKTIMLKNIADAGEAIKLAAIIMIILFILSAIGLLIITNSTSSDAIEGVYTLGGIAFFIGQLVIIYNLYTAGKSLKESVIEKKESEN